MDESPAGPPAGLQGSPVGRMAALKAAAKMKKNIEGSEAKTEGDKKRQTGTLRYDVNELLDNPKSSAGIVVTAILTVVIVLSTICFVAETVPAWEHIPVWYHLEAFFVAIFTIELLVRLWATPLSFTEFFSDPLNIIDLLAILPFYFMVIGGWELVDCRVLRIFRLVRAFKIGRYYAPLLLIINTLVRSWKSLVLCLFFLATGLICFGSFMWIFERGDWNEKLDCYARSLCTSAERGTWHDDHECFIYVDSGCSPFQSIPSAFWWGITTMSTVGYGDTYPVTFRGRMVAGVAMVTGILCIALPTTVLAVEFADKYKALMEENVMAEQVKDQKQKMTHAEKSIFTECKKLRDHENKLEQLLPRLQYILAQHSMEMTIETMSTASTSSHPVVDPRVQDAHAILQRVASRAVTGVKAYRSCVHHFVPKLCPP